MNEFSIICRNRDDTSYVATAISPLLSPGDAIMLKGDLASGKTTFVQELVAALGSEEQNVTSPTFTVAHFYPVKAGTFLHIDAYRLSSIAEFRDLGLEDYTDKSITAVEWGNIVEDDFPDSLSIAFEFANGNETSRKLTFSASTERWDIRLRQLRLLLGDYLNE